MAIICPEGSYFMSRFILTSFAAALAVVATAAASGCKDEPQPGASAPAQTDGGSAAGKKADEHEHADGTKHTDGDEKAGGDEHANRVELGTKTIGNLTLKGMQDEPVKAGGEGAFDVIITGGKPKAVRFWVGTENGQGSVKAKAAEETPDNWHTHVELPDPLPTSSKFWVEVEPQTGAPFKASFDLAKEDDHDHDKKGS